MKHAYLTALTLALLTAFAPHAEAASYRRVFDGYDRCGRPVYVWVRQSSSSCAPRYRTDCEPRHRDYFSGYRRPILFHDAYSSSARDCYSSPRFSIRIGF